MIGRPPLLVAPLIAFLATSCGLALSGELKIEGTPAAKPGELIKLKASGAEGNSALLWRVSPTDPKLKHDRSSVTEYKPDLLEFTGEAGAYRVELLELSVVDGKPKLREKTLEVRIIPSPPAPAKPPTDPPPDPPADPGAGVIHFMVVRPDGPAHPTFTQVMSLPAWGQLLSRGFEVSQLTLTEARALVTIPEGTALPTVITLRITPDRKYSKRVRGPAPLPGTDAGVLSLAEGLTTTTPQPSPSDQ